MSTRRLLGFLPLFLLVPISVKTQTVESLAAQRASRFLDALSGRSERPIKCGLAQALAYHRGEMPVRSADLPRLQQVFQRPQLPLSYVSENGHFRIHYALDGPDAVDPTATNPDGVPDYVFETAKAAERAYFLLVDSLGFRPHLDDDNIDGPEYDIYIEQLGNVYGWTNPENRVSQSPLRYTAFTRIDNDFVGGYYTHGLDAMRVTVAHEYFHAVQFAYHFRNSDIYFFEMSSVWFEDIAFDSVNDYLQYLPSFFSQLDRPLHLINDWHEYGASLFLKYWLQDRDFRSLRRMWEDMPSRPALEAIAAEVNRQGVPFAEALAEFYSWCLYTGDRAVPGRYFREAELYPAISIAPRRFIEMHKDTTVADSIRPLSARFYQFTVDPSLNFSAGLESPRPSVWRVLVASERLNGGLEEARWQQGPAPLLLKATENEGKVFVAAVNGGLPANPQTQAEFLPRERYNLQLSLRSPEALAGGMLPPRPNPFVVDGQSGLSVIYNLDEAAEVTLAIVDERGVPVLLRKIGPKPRGLNQFVWNGFDAEGNPVPSGIYVILLRTSPGGQQARKVAVIRP